jgi:exosortase
VDTGGGLFAPIVSAYLVWSRRDELKGLDPARSHWGTIALVLGLLLFIGGIWGRFASLMTLSLVLVVWGLVATMGGYELGKKLAFPVAYLAFLCPAPTVLDNLSLPLRQFATIVASILPDMLGMETRLEGTELIVDGFRTMVDAPCSGLSYLLSLFAASTLVAYLSRCSMTRKVLFGLSALPVALLANILRIQATFLLHSVFGDIFSEGVGHFLVGIIVLVFALLSLLALWSLICQHSNDASSSAQHS